MVQMRTERRSLYSQVIANSRDVKNIANLMGTSDSTFGQILALLRHCSHWRAD
jgi:hypothetical protein